MKRVDYDEVRQRVPHSMNRVMRVMLWSSGAIGGSVFGHYLYTHRKGYGSIPSSERIWDLPAAVRKFELERNRQLLDASKLDALREEECYQRISRCLCTALSNGKDWVTIGVTVSSDCNKDLSKALETRFKTQGLNITVTDDREFMQTCSWLTAKLAQSVE